MTFSQRAVEAAIQAIDKLDHRKATSMADLTRQIAEAALTAALAVDGVALQGWQNISTAPKDGTRILAFAMRKGRPIRSVTWWRRSEDNAGYTGWGEFNESFWPATHWTPLPQPPAASEGEERK